MNSDTPPAATPIPVIDGHNDTLLSLHLKERGGGRSFFERSETGHVDLPRAREGGLAGGFFAAFVPPDPSVPRPPNDGFTQTAEGYTMPLPPPLDLAYAQRTAMALSARLMRIEAESDGQVKLVRTADELAACLERGTLATILHFEGAEAIGPDLDALEVFYRAGLRSLGLTWSRPNAFAEGVPFMFPGSPDTGTGLTEAGRELVRACNRLGIMLDLSHLNERGFWDVAALSQAPLVATHSNAHTLCPVPRNLTDRQLDAIGESGGIVGITFALEFVRADGDPSHVETPLDEIVRHVDYVVERIGLDHVAFGSDFDGADMPRDLSDVSSLPNLIATLRAHGYDDAALRKLAHENWLRLLRTTWAE